METEEGRDRVMRARKRKADAAGKEDKSGDAVVPAIEDCSFCGHRAVGHPEARVDPLGRPAPERRPMEDPAEGSPSQKRAKSPERRGRKREGDAAVESAMQEERQEAGASSSGNACGGAQSSAGADPATASILEKVCSEVLLGLDKTSVPETIREMNQLYKSLGMSGVDVAEIYNPERFTSKANAFGLQPGFAIDLTLQKDDKGNHWDLSKTEHQKKLKELLWKEKPAFLIGSPHCCPERSHFGGGQVAPSRGG